ncbi:hypothetical protein SUGI_0464050 [Cryptomeria japonica]|nr:hypothetical protein SUGI_0464050 [Cryptomeria japonica]
MDIGDVFRFSIYVCLVGFIAAKCDPETCGLMSLSYPFWVHNSDCGYPGFQIKCKKEKSTGILAPFLPVLLDTNNNGLESTDYKIMEINYTGYLIINSSSLKAWSCEEKESSVRTLQLPPKGPFTISMLNRLVVIGCHTFGAYTYDTWGDVTCVSVCVSQSDPPYCRYGGCCEVNIPDNWKWLNFTGGGVFGLRNHSTNAFDRKCGFSTVLEPSTFTQVDNETNLFWGEGFKASYGLRLNWGIGLQNCSMAKSTADCSCSSNAECMKSPSWMGHVCKCLPGYEGNGYSNGTGCTDVDECISLKLNECVEPLKGGICHNLAGAYNCSCAKGYIGDGYQNGTRCASTNSNYNSIIPAIIGSVSSFAGVSLGACGLFWCLRRRRLRQKLMAELHEEIVSQGGKCLEIFSEKELKRASESYSNKLGEGSFGTVYKGKLRDGRQVAIKKPVLAAEVLFNEVIILSLMSHRNIVKLLGCCMESKNQLLSLVYEFVSNGTLEEHIQSPESRSWQRRLQIAIESAEAVEYMHHYAPQPIFHRDIKSSNILLDDNFTPKVADFGISRLLPLNKAYLTSDYLSGSLGYLDPQFKATHRFTNKSDVYSFGVVLVQLLTGEPAVKFRDNTTHYLSSYFLSAYNENRLNEILDPKVELSDRTVEQMNKMAELAKDCLQMEGTARPSMREVVEELGWIRDGIRQPGIYRDVKYAWKIIMPKQVVCYKHSSYIHIYIIVICEEDYTMK